MPDVLSIASLQGQAPDQDNFVPFSGRSQIGDGFGQSQGRRQRWASSASGLQNAGSNQQQAQS